MIELIVRLTQADPVSPQVACSSSSRSITYTLRAAGMLSARLLTVALLTNDDPDHQLGPRCMKRLMKVEGTLAKISVNGHRHPSHPSRLHIYLYIISRYNIECPSVYRVHRSAYSYPLQHQRIIGHVKFSSLDHLFGHLPVCLPIR